MSGATVLIADDSLVIRAVVRAGLEGEGYSVREAVDGTTALEECRQQPPDVVLLDIPGRWGGEEFLVTSARSASSSRPPPAATAAVHPAR